MKKKFLTFTENLLLSLEQFTHDVLSQPVIINKTYWEAVNIEKERRKQARREKQKYYNTINRLAKYGYLIKEKKNNQIALKFTNKGMLKLQKIKWKNTKPKNKLSKKEFCLVVFDIPENKKRIRNLFRKCLYELGFNKIQKSVFASNNEMVDEIKQLIKNCELENHVQVMIARKA